MAEQNAKQNNAVNALRVFLTLTVVVFHALLAYTTTASGSLIDDAKQTIVYDVPICFLDLWFMSLFFFLSGLFVWNSLERKGAGRFLLSRFLRLGIPYVLGIFLYNVPAFFFGYWSQLKQQNPGAVLGLGDYLRFWKDHLLDDEGHLWFLWVLFAFNLVIVLFRFLVPKFADFVMRSKSKFLTQPSVFYSVSILLVLVLHGVLWATVPDGFVTIFLPFKMQLTRLLQYFAVFFIGVLMGIKGLDQTLFDVRLKQAKNWWWQLTVAFILSCLYMFLPNSDTQWIQIIRSAAVGILAAVVCVLAAFGCFNLFLLHGTKRTKFRDNLTTCAFGMYLFHYPIVAALQFIFLNVDASVWTKGFLVSSLSLLCTWLVANGVNAAGKVARKSATSQRNLSA